MKNLISVRLSALFVVARPAFAFLPRAPFPNHHRPWRSTTLPFSFEDVFGERIYTAAQALGVSSSELVIGAPFAVFGVAFTTTLAGLAARDGLRKDLNATQAVLEIKRNQLAVTNRKTSVSEVALKIGFSCS